jgi:hypothetical protein
MQGWALALRKNKANLKVNPTKNLCVLRASVENIVNLFHKIKKPRVLDPGLKYFFID